MKRGCTLTTGMESWHFVAARFPHLPISSTRHQIIQTALRLLCYLTMHIEEPFDSPLMAQPTLGDCFLQECSCALQSLNILSDSGIPLVGVKTYAVYAPSILRSGQVCGADLISEAPAVDGAHQLGDLLLWSFSSAEYSRPSSRHSFDRY